MNNNSQSTRQIPTLAIHNLSADHFRLDLSEYRLTFDDGLFSQYYYYPLWGGGNKPIHVFPVTEFLRKGPARSRFDGRHLPYVKSKKYMYEFFVKNKADIFLTIDELKWLKERNGVVLGAHSHAHSVVLTDMSPKKPNSKWKKSRFPGVPDQLLQSKGIRSRMAYTGAAYRNGELVPRTAGEWERDVREDTEKCLQWFHRHLGMQPTAYGFPFNEFSQELIDILKQYGFRTFFAGPRSRHPEVIPRIDIDGQLTARGLWHE